MRKALRIIFPCLGVLVFVGIALAWVWWVADLVAKYFAKITWPGW